MTNSGKSRELTDQTMANTTQGHALSSSDWLDSHFEAAREAYEKAAYYADIQPGWKLLDAGAGGGSYLPLLSTLVGSTGTLDAIDLAPENVVAIRQRATANGFNCPITAQTGSVTALPFDDGTFDAVWCANVLQYLSDSELSTALDEFTRVVRPGGFVIIKDSDFSAVLLGTNPRTFWHFVEAAQTHPQFGALARAYLRTVRLPQLLRQSNIDLIRQKTFLSEWRQPLRPVDRAYLKTSMPLYGAIAADLDLPADEQAFWRHVGDVETESDYINSADFYYREAFAVFVAQKPTAN
ncbi:MAG: class I SAM-dependent methyltransferase [Chloroflexota bacterium]